MKDYFTLYATCKFKGKNVVIGESTVDGKTFNDAYFVTKDNKYKKIPLTDENKPFLKLFGIYQDAIDFEKAKEIEDKYKVPNSEKLEDINIEDYMPKNLSDEEYQTILLMLNRIREMFGKVTAENLKGRLPDMKVVNDTKRSTITAAYYRPKANVFGFCSDDIKTNEGMAYSIHELNHMVSSKVGYDKDKDKTFRFERTGFVDESGNGVGITEGFNELLSSIARKGGTISYDKEVSIATLVYILSESPTSVVKSFYEGDLTRCLDFGDTEEDVKMFMKNMDYFNRMTYYETNRYVSTVKYVKKLMSDAVIKYKVQNGLENNIEAEEEKEIHTQACKKAMSIYTPDIEDSDFLANAEYILLDMYDKFLDRENRPEVIAAGIDSTIRCMTFGFDFDTKSEHSKFNYESFEKVDEKFFDIMNEHGFDQDATTDILVGVYTDCKKEKEEIKNKKKEIFDDKKIVDAYNRTKPKKEKDDSIDADYEEETEDGDIEDEFIYNDLDDNEIEL